SPLERILPVSLEMRSEHRKLKLSIVVCLDRSGSMGASVGGSKTKMDLANLGTAQVMDLLGPLDEFGVIATDSTPHTILDLDLVENNRMERGTVLSIQSMGGGIFVYEGLSAAARMISKGSSQTKHVILFSDAMDSEQPGNYQDLLKHMTDAGISVSVIGLGTDSDRDAALLKDIAKLGNGNIYFTAKPTELPRIFAQDTFTVARSTFVEEETKVKMTVGIRSIGGSPQWEPPAVGGYNLTYLRQDANLPLLSEDEYKAPIVANWQAGSGRVLCYAGEADGEFAGPISQWEDIGDFYSTLVRWTAGEQQPLPDGMLLTQEVRDGVNYVQLHLDPEREKDPFQGQPEARILHGIPGVTPRKKTLSMDWKNADQLEVVIPVRGRETVLATIAIPGLKPQSLPPVCLPYSPEFAPAQANRGRATLENISATTGGRERIDLSAIWETLIAEAQYIDIAVWLIMAGLLAFLLEVFQRRTGLLTFVEKTRPAAESEAGTVEVTRPKWFEFIKPATTKGTKSARKKTARRKTKRTKPKATPAPTAGKAESKTDNKSGGNINALREAMKRAKKRRGD
ncbi:MAG: VWA domain-containing protein, partial [Limisphaerales bacterium]